MRTVRTYLKAGSKIACLQEAWERSWSVTEFTFNPETLTGFIKRKTHVTKVTIECPCGLEDNFVEVYFDGGLRRNSPMTSRFFPANTVAVYKEHKAG